MRVSRQNDSWMDIQLRMHLMAMSMLTSHLYTSDMVDMGPSRLGQNGYAKWDAVSIAIDGQSASAC